MTSKRNNEQSTYMTPKAQQQAIKSFGVIYVDCLLLSFGVMFLDCSLLRFDVMCLDC
jgi:hypothetical protein